MRSKTLFAAGLMAASVPAFSQSDAPSPPAARSQPRQSRTILGLAPALGVASFDFADFNTRAAAAGLPQMLDGGGAFGMVALQFHNRRDRTFYDFSLGYDADGVEANGFSLYQQAATIDANVNVRVLRRDRHRLTPGAGFGLAAFSAQYAQLAPAAASFNAALSAINAERTFEAAAYYINTKLAYDFALFPERDVFIGATAGYRIGVGGQRWTVLNSTANDGPRSTASGYFLGAMLSVRF